jgi:hypothetical protein
MQTADAMNTEGTRHRHAHGNPCAATRTYSYDIVYITLEFATPGVAPPSETYWA